MIELERDFSHYAWVVGLDEVGRGPLAGPVVAGAVFSRQSLANLGIRDSKKLSAKQRDSVLSRMGVSRATWSDRNATIILGESDYLAYALAVVSPKEIDRMNIRRASLVAMQRAFEALQLNSRPGLLLIDGNVPLETTVSGIEQETLVKGDARSLLIGAASIIAKEYRDDLMAYYHEIYPCYGFGEHAGYPTARHLAAIRDHGVTPIHRRSFRGVKEHV